MCFLLLNNEKPTQLLADVVLDDPGEDWVLGEIVEAPVGGAVEVDEVVKVGDEAVLPLEGHVVLPDVLEVEKRLRDKTIKKKVSVSICYDDTIVNFEFEKVSLKLKVMAISEYFRS